MGTLKAVANRSEAFLQNFQSLFPGGGDPDDRYAQFRLQPPQIDVMPAAAASSIRLTQSMTRSVRSMTSSASSRLRSRFVASQTASVQQRSSRARNSVAISSSREQPCSE